MADHRNKARFDGVRCIRETDAALLVVIDGQQHWMPKSHVDDDSEVYAEGHDGELVVSEWIAVEKGLV